MKSILKPIRGTPSVDGFPHSYLLLLPFPRTLRNSLHPSAVDVVVKFARLHLQYNFIRRFHLLLHLLRALLSLYTKCNEH